MPPPTTESKRGHAAADNHQTVMPGIHGWYTQAICMEITWLTLATAPRATSTKGKTQCLFLAIVNKTMVVDSWAWRDQPIDQVGPFLTSRLHELRAEVVYCQWQCTLLQTLNLTQPPGSHHPLHGLHLTANKVPHTRSCVGIGHSPRECSPLHHGEVPTHAGDLSVSAGNNWIDSDISMSAPLPTHTRTRTYTRTHAHINTYAYIL